MKFYFRLIMRNEGHVYEKKSSWLSKRLKDDPILDSERKNLF